MLDLFTLRLHDDAVRRVLSLLLALTVAMWLPVQVAVSERDITPPNASGSLQSELPPAHAATALSPVIGGTTSTFHIRHVHDAIATVSWFPGHALVSSTADSPPPRGPHAAPQLRTYPLLI